LDLVVCFATCDWFDFTGGAGVCLGGVFAGSGTVFFAEPGIDLSVWSETGDAVVGFTGDAVAGDGTGFTGSMDCVTRDVTGFATVAGLLEFPRCNFSQLRKACTPISKPAAST
jgi:hypothetical protein